MSYKRYFPVWLKWLWRVMRTVQNWPSIALGRRVAHMRSGNYVAVGTQQFIDHVNLEYEWPEAKVRKDVITFTYEEHTIRFATGNELNLSAMEIFKRETYKPYVKAALGKDVLDLGAAQGDSAIFYALHGSAQVYAYEIDPGRARLAEINVHANYLQMACNVYNQGAGSAEGCLSLKEMVKRHSLADAYLKLDCDGAEYDIIPSSDRDTLRAFSYILIEYDYGPETLVAPLEAAGFRTSIHQPNKTSGYLVAIRI
jgi:hypothetical protein